MGGSEYHSSGDDSDISESEIEEYAEISYKELKNGNHRVETFENAFSCPYCSPRKRKHDFLYQDILLHADSFASCYSEKQSIKDKANHLALAKYLKTDVAVCNGTDKANVEVDALPKHESDELFVWPWIGIVVNIPTELINVRHTGRSGSKLKDDLTASGFNPTRVKALYNDMGHSGTAVVEFDPDWSGFANAMSFENAYEGDHHGKADWKVDNGQKSGLYGWLAHADDYNSDNIIGENLRKTRDVKKLSDIIEEEDRKVNKLVERLADVLDIKNFHLKRMENKVKKIETSRGRVFAEYDKLRHSYSEELEKLQSTAQEYFQKILDDHEKFKFQVETEKKELELRGKELEQREARNQSERKRLLEELQKMACHLKPVACDEEERYFHPDQWDAPAVPTTYTPDSPGGPSDPDVSPRRHDAPVVGPSYSLLDTHDSPDGHSPTRHAAPVVGPSHTLLDESDAYLVDHELLERKLDDCTRKCEESMRVHCEVLQLVREMHNTFQMHVRRVTPGTHEGTTGAAPQPHTTIQHTTMAPQIPDVVHHSEPTPETSDPISDQVSPVARSQ